jgi:hypothetical protein
MPLNEREIQQLVAKLREKYAEYTKKHHQRWFDPAPFEERLAMAIKNKMNLEGFILAEIANFEKTRERFEQKKKASENSFSKEVDRIIEEQNARIKKYHPDYFHPGADFEIAHFYGATRELALHFFPVLWIVIDEPALKTPHEIDDELSRLCMPGAPAPAKRIKTTTDSLAAPASELKLKRTETAT